MKDFFVSYNKADRPWAEWIAWQLEEAGYSVIIQAWDFRPGSNFVLNMQRALEEAARVVAVLSPDYLAARFTQPEWAAAFVADPTGAQQTLLPVRVRECSLKGLWQPTVYVDLVGLSEASAKAELLAGTNRERTKPSTEPTFPAVVQHSISAKPDFTEVLLHTYLANLANRVSTVRIFGDSEPHQLDQVFVELTINEEYDRRPNQAKFFSLMDAELRCMRSVFGDADEYRDREGADNDNQRGLSHLTAKTKRTIKPDDLLRPRTHAIVTGAPGCGKTTLLRYLGWQTLQQFVVPASAGSAHNQTLPAEAGTTNVNARFPIFLELKQLTAAHFQQAQGQLEELLFAAALAATLKPDEAERHALKQYFFNLLRTGRVAIFMDGLDEVSGASFFRDLQVSVSEFLHSIYGGNTVIISTRPFALRQLGDAQAMEIQPLSPRQIEQFIAHYYHSTSPDAPARGAFQRELQRRRELRELARVPALLSFILQLWRKRGSVTDDKLELYAQITRELAAQLDREKEGIAPEREWLVADPDGSLKLDLLRQLAFHQLFRGLIHPPYEIGGNTNDVARLVFTSEQLRAEAAAFAHTIKQREGITINPRHLTEDVKATALLRQVGADHYAFAHLTLQEYLAAWQLAKGDNADTCERIFCRAYFNPTLAEMEVLPMIIGLIDKVDRLYESLEQLPESLDFKQLRLRVRGLGYTDKLSHHTFSNLLAAFRSLEDSSNDPKKLGYQKAVWLSLNGFRQCWLDSIAKEMLCLTQRLHFISLYEIQDLPLLKRLREMLDDSPSLDRGFSKMRIDWMIQTMESKETSVYEEVSDLTDTSPTTEAHIERLLANLRDQDFNVRWRAASELGNFKTARVKSALLEALSDQSLFVRRRAAESAGKIGGDEVVRALIPLLKDRVSGVRLRAAFELRKIADDRVLEPMLDALEDEYQQVRVEAIRALGLIGDHRAIDRLLLEVKSGVHSALAAEAIGRLNHRHLSAGLTRAFSHKDNYVRGRAIEYIGYYGNTVEIHQKLSHIATNDGLKGMRNIASEALARYERKLQYFDIPVPPTTN